MAADGAGRPPVEGDAFGTAGDHPAAESTALHDAQSDPGAKSQFQKTEAMTAIQVDAVDDDVGLTGTVPKRELIPASMRAPPWKYMGHASHYVPAAGKEQDLFFRLHGGNGACGDGELW